MNNQSELVQFDPYNFDFIKKIGQGTCSTTWKAEDKASGKYFALKIIQNSKLLHKKPEFLSFLSQAKQFACPSLISHYHSYSDISNLYLVHELVEGGTLLHKLFMDKLFDEPQAFTYFHQILKSLEYLYSVSPPMSHGDIRLENVFLSKKGLVKLNFVGCGNFLVRGIGSLNKDFKSLGVLLYEMVCGCSSLSLTEKEKFFGEFCEGKVPKNLSSELKDLLVILISQKTAVSFEIINTHSWVTNEGNCVSNQDEDNHSLEKEDRESIFSTNFTEVHATRESLTTFELKEDNENDAEVAKILEYRILMLETEKKDLEQSEKKLRSLLESTDLQLTDLESLTCGLDIFDQLNNLQRDLLEKKQSCKRQKIYLSRLKRQTDHCIKDLEAKETQLKSLTDSVKSLNLGISKIKSHRSLDLSSLRINLDVLQYKIGERTPKGSNSAELTIQDLKELVSTRTESIKFLTKSEYKEKIHKCLSNTSEIHQKIADLNLNYELERGKILQSFSRAKEHFNNIIKKNREKYFKAKVSGNEIDNLNLSVTIGQIAKQKNEEMSLQGEIHKVNEKIEGLKEGIRTLYAKIKIVKKDRFRNERKIDSRQLEIDDLKVDIHSLKSFLTRIIWKSG